MEETLTIEKKRRTLSEVIEDHPKSIFWTRLLLWFSFAGVLPFLFIAWRFELFRAVSKFQIGGWGLIAIAIVFFTVLTAVKYVKIALSAKWSMTVQCINGFMKIILPLLVLLAFLKGIQNNIELMIQAVGCTTLCEAVAIPLNPLPKWAYEMQKEVRDTEKKDTMDYLLGEFFRRQKEDKK